VTQIIHNNGPTGSQVIVRQSNHSVVMLLGAERFERHFEVWSLALTLAGHVVLMPSFDKPVSPHGGFAAFAMAMLDDRQRKIELASKVALLNPYAYLDDATLNDVRHALTCGCELYALESWFTGLGVGETHTEITRTRKERLGIPKDYVSPIDTSRMGMMTDLLLCAGDARMALMYLVRSAEVNS